MKEIHDIIAAYDKVQHHKQTALATVVQVEGSSYRRPGARMLIEEDGQLTGAISGGCLEGDALRKALLVMAQQHPMLVMYDTNDEDDAKLGMGLGCNGIIHILIEPIDPTDDKNPLQLLKAAASKRQPIVIVSLYSFQHKKDIQQGTVLLFNSSLQIEKDNGIPKAFLLTDAKEALDQKNSALKEYRIQDREYTAFVEYIEPVVSLVIIGGGNDVIPLVKMAAVMGWETTIVDGRPAYATADRFPANCRVMLSRPENVLNAINTGARTAFVLMTHNYNYEMALLPLLMNTDTPYIGMLGPRKKKERMLNELKENNICFSEEQLTVLHGPAGLDIGAEAPEEIALSIIAQIKAVLSASDATPLSDNTEPIHARRKSFSLSQQIIK
jgi:xanthine dehydrogenase accessory factor